MGIAAMFLGVDGGGSKTAYALIDSAGSLRATHVGGTVSYFSEGVERAGAALVEGIRAVLTKAALAPADLVFSFIGLPSYGEDSAMTSPLDAMPAALLDTSRYRCGNDMVCSWAGSLGCTDGISVISGTGSMAYGEYAGRKARAGGWGELIGDEGSARWIAREGMNVFSRMSDGRLAVGPLYGLVRERMNIRTDSDICAHIYGAGSDKRRTFAQFAPLVHEAAQAGDDHAAEIFRRAAGELVACVLATRHSLAVPEAVVLPVSHSGGVFGGASLLVDEFDDALAAAELPFEHRLPQYPPAVGAALYAAKLAGMPLDEAALQSLRQQSASAALPR